MTARDDGRPEPVAPPEDDGGWTVKGPITRRLEIYKRTLEDSFEERMAARMEHDRRKSTRGSLTMIGALVAALSGVGVTLGQFGVLSPEGGWAWVSKAQYAADRVIDSKWRETVNDKLDKLIEARRGRR